MITLSILPNFKGTKLEFFYATLICMILDSTYLLPIIKHI